MKTREKLIELLQDCVDENVELDEPFVTVDVGYGNIADHLIANDVVPVVRCKGCKHFTKGMAVGMCKRIEDKPILPIPHNHFCSFGEREDDER